MPKMKPKRKPSKKVKPVQNDRVMLQRLLLIVDMRTAGIYPSEMVKKIADMNIEQNPSGWKPTVDEIHELSKNIKNVSSLLDFSDDYFRTFIDLCCIKIHAESMRSGDHKNALGALQLIAFTHQLGRPEKKKTDEKRPLDMSTLRTHYKREVGEK